MYAILNSNGEAEALNIPGSAGMFSVCAVFGTRKAARIALKCLADGPPRKIVKVSVVITRIGSK
jgi:hypothetical protein